MWLILLISLLPLPLIFILRVITGNTVTNNHPAHLVFVTVIFATALVVLFLFLFLRLTVQADEAGVWYGFNFPDRSLNLLKWENIRSYKLIQYPFIGYGYHAHPTYGTIYNTRGNTGILIATQSGENLLLGTHFPRELIFTLDLYLKKPVI